MVENGNGNNWYRNKIKAIEFARILKRNVGQPDARYVVFLGAGCSVTSGIPSASTLVVKWLRELMGYPTPSDEAVLTYGEKNIAGFNKDDPAFSYGEVFKWIYPESALRQAEIEGICAKAYPKLGYVVLARLMTHKEFGPGFNFALTTNFDDLISESIYLYTKSKPRGYVHESLFEHMHVSSTMPTIVKLHGDAHIDIRNIDEETKEFDTDVKSVLRNVMHQKGLIFIGYGGNDRSVADFLKEIPRSSFPSGIFWVGINPPGERLLEALEKLGEVTWVEHRDFDLLMLYIRNVFEIELPEEEEYSERFHIFKESYFKILEEIDEIGRETDDAEDQKSIEEAVKEGAKQYDYWWVVELEASKYKETDPDRADEIYRDGLKEFPDSSELMGNYANFLWKIRRDYPAAEEYYKRAIKADLDNAVNLGNYAGFLLAHGRQKEGFDYLSKSQDSQPEDDQKLENHFYLYAHGEDEKERADALKQIKELITSGVRSPDWDLSQNVARAVEDGHPEQELLALMAKVIADEADASELDKFEAWKEA